MKKGRPKCICAPSCKTSKQAKQLPKQNIKVINLSESQRNRGQYFSSGPRAVASRSAPSIQLSASSSKRSVRVLGDDPSTHHSRTLKSSLSEKTLSQRNSNRKLDSSKHKDNLFESVTLVDSKHTDNRSRTNCTTAASVGRKRPSDCMALMADGPTKINMFPVANESLALATSSPTSVRHRNRKNFVNHNRTHHDQPSHHSRDFGKPRLLRVAARRDNVTTLPVRVPRHPQYPEEMFFVGTVPQTRRSRMQGRDLDIGNDIMVSCVR